MRECLIIGLLAVIPFQARDSTPQKHEQETKQSPAPPTAPNVQPTPSPDTNSSNNRKSDSLSKRLVDALITNWPLVAVGVLGIWAALRTLKAIERQADAMINSERAWVVPELVPINVHFEGGRWARRIGERFASLSEEAILKGEHLKHQIQFTNMGRTPAHILRYQVGYSSEVEEVGTELRMADIVKPTGVEFDRLLGGSDTIEGVKEIDVFQYVTDSNMTTSDSKTVGIMQGWVEYQHVFSDTEVVRVPFAYLYDSTTMRLTKIPLRKPQKRKENHRPS